MPELLLMTDPIVLPGMVVPIALDDAAQAAIDCRGDLADGWMVTGLRPSEQRLD